MSLGCAQSNHRGNRPRVLSSSPEADIMLEASTVLRGMIVYHANSSAVNRPRLKSKCV